MITGAAWFIQMDEAHYPRAHEFDPWRFYDDKTNTATTKSTTATNTFLAFGHGSVLSGPLPRRPAHADRVCQDADAVRVRVGGRAEGQAGKCRPAGPAAATVYGDDRARGEGGGVRHACTTGGKGRAGIMDFFRVCQFRGDVPCEAKYLQVPTLLTVV
jgi:hypothetical protein